MPIVTYFGTYTGGKSKGIYVYRLEDTGALIPIGVGAGVENPSFLQLHPSGRFLYAACETYGASGGTVAAFSLDSQGLPTLLNQQSSQGQGPCHIALDRAGKHIFVANYGSGSVAVLPIASDGKVLPASASVQHRGSSVNKARQGEPHAHSFNPDRQDRYAVAADLGIDKLLVYRFDADRGALTPNDPPFVATAPGAGPRHFAFHPNGRLAYAINELNSTVTGYRYDGNKGTLREIETVSALPEGFAGTSFTAEVQVHPSGRFLLGSNRGHDSIVVFAIDGRTGKLRLLGHAPTQGRQPRHFGITPNGKMVVAANQESDSVLVSRFDTATGKMTPLAAPLEIPKPVCVQFLTL